MLSRKCRKVPFIPGVIVYKMSLITVSKSLSWTKAKACGQYFYCCIPGVVEFLSAGRVSAEHRDFKELGYAASLRRMPGSEHEFTHNFKLASAYSEDIMPYTNYTWVFFHMIINLSQFSSGHYLHLPVSDLVPVPSSSCRFWLPCIGNQSIWPGDVLHLVRSENCKQVDVSTLSPSPGLPSTQRPVCSSEFVHCQYSFLW